MCVGYLERVWEGYTCMCFWYLEKCGCGTHGDGLVLVSGKSVGEEGLVWYLDRV